MNTNLAAIQRRLDAIALDQLREHVVELSERLEIAEAYAQAADARAEMFLDMSNDLQDRLAELGDPVSLGITKEGEVGVLAHV
ncbi:MAG: hypothetical protein IJI03_12435 [Rudaea sp.]|nr:hypothetical protein [Rudaea sp.]